MLLASGAAIPISALKIGDKVLATKTRTDRPAPVKSVVIDLLFLLLNGGSVEDPDLARRCRERAIRGVWLLVREAVSGSEGVRRAVLEVLDLVDSSQADAVREWLAS